MRYGQGSVTQDKRGHWRARYYGPDGKQRSKTFRRKTDAQDYLASMKTDRNRGDWIDPKGGEVLFGKWVAEWLRSKHTLGEAARARDESLLKNHVLPAFEDTPIGRIGPLDIRAWVNDLVDAGLSPRTIHACYRIAASSLRAAAAARLIGDPPLGVGVIHLPKIERKPERFLTEGEVETLATAMMEHYQPLVYTLAYTGCRWQEIAGLKRCFLDVPKSQLHVRGVLARTKSGYRYKTHPKTDAARRTVTLPRFVAEMLKERAEDHDTEWVFTGPGGARLDGSNFRRPWKTAINKVGLEHLTVHDLRHTHAAWLIRDGIQPLALQRRLGHKDIRTTMNVYGHLFPNFEQDLVETLDRRRAEAMGESAKIVSLKARR